MLLVVGEQTKVLQSLNNIKYPGFLPGIFSGGVSFVTQISFVMSIFLLFPSGRKPVSLELFDH